MKVKVDINIDGVITIENNNKLVPIGCLYPHINPEQLMQSIKPKKIPANYKANHFKDIDKKVLYQAMDLCEGGINFATQSNETKSWHIYLNINDLDNPSRLSDIIDIGRPDLCVSRLHGVLKPFNNFEYQWSYATSIKTRQPSMRRKYVSVLLLKILNRSTGMIEIFCTPYQCFTSPTQMDKINYYQPNINKTQVYSALHNALDIMKNRFPDSRSNWKRKGMK